MKATIAGITLEGTPEEIARLMRLVGADAPTLPIVVPSPLSPPPNPYAPIPAWPWWADPTKPGGGQAMYRTDPDVTMWN